MTYGEKAVFAIGVGLCFLAFSPLNAPGGPEVAVGGFVVSVAVAAGLYIKGLMS